MTFAHVSALLGVTAIPKELLHQSARLVLSVLNRSVSKTIALAFGLRLHSKTWCSKKCIFQGGGSQMESPI